MGEGVGGCTTIDLFKGELKLIIFRCELIKGT